MSQPAQLSLAVQLPDDETFASFYPGDNAQLITNLKNAAIGQGAPLLFVWGSRGAGRSHLLHATCAEVNASGEAAAYIPLEQHAMFEPGVLEQMEQLPLVCLDNLDAIAGNAQWEESLFDFFNRWKEHNQGSLIVTAATAPRKIGLCLPDLASRLDWGLSYQLHELDDEGDLEMVNIRSPKVMASLWDF